MLQKIKKKIHFETILQVIPSLIFLVFICFTMVFSYTDPIKNRITFAVTSSWGLKTLPEELDGMLQGNLYCREGYINLNGLTTRILGIHTLNDVQKLENGYLADLEGMKDVSHPSEQVIQLNNFLDSKGIDFLYVLAPSKASIYDADFAPGYGSEAWKNIDAMIDAVSSAGVNTIDMNRYFQETGMKTEDVFYKTDHHWLPEAAFAAAHKSMQYMREAFGMQYDDSMADFEKWDVKTYEDYFLGYAGKRVGTKYAGLDDISLIRRKDRNAVDFSFLSYGTTIWNYRDSVIDGKLLQESDYFNLDPYRCYIGNNYPLVRIKNPRAENGKKLLVVGDSFKLSFEAFLSECFSELYHLDTRYYTDGTVAQYIEESQPDIVLMCTYEDSLDSEKLYEFGVTEYMEALANTNPNETPVPLGDCTIEANTDVNHFRVIAGNLQPDQTYTLTVDTTAMSGGEGAYIQMTLQNLTENQAVFNRYLDTDSQETQKWIFTTPEDVNANYGLYLYAGVKGQTENVSVAVSNIQLQKGIIED